MYTVISTYAFMRVWLASRERERESPSPFFEIDSQVLQASA
jgi:hypothetical protein